MADPDSAREVHVPVHLYKYRSLAGEAKAYARDLILHQRLFFPGPANLNDPFECKPYLAELSTPHQQREYAKGLANRMAPAAPRGERRRVLRNITANRGGLVAGMKQSTMEALGAVGVFSMSVEPRDLLMWPHYADSHRGVCVRFSFHALMAEDLVPFPVIYAEDRPVCDTMIEPVPEWVKKAVLTKANAWEYEQEWRIVKSRGARQLVEPLRQVVDGVILGANISADDRAEVLGWAERSSRPIALAQARFHPTSYRLEITDL